MGCTQIPVSQETGLGPEEYEGIAGTEEIKKENLSLKEELDGTKTELNEFKTKFEELLNEIITSDRSTCLSPVRSFTLNPVVNKFAELNI